MKSCFLFGHANCPHAILPKIEAAIERHYLQFGVRCFYVGNRGAFDLLAAAAAEHIKLRYPDLQLHLLLAYHPAERAFILPDSFDNSFYPPLENVPKPYAIVRANRHMVDTADYLICYVQHFGNSRNLLEYAHLRQRNTALHIENIADTL